jgi:hypothetical protein
VTEDGFEDQVVQPPAPFQVPRPTKFLTATLLVADVAERVHSEKMNSKTAVAFWLEALDIHLPPTLAHPAPMVGCLMPERSCTCSLLQLVS